MGEHGVRARPSGLLPNGISNNEAANVTRVLDMDRLLKAEKRTAELMSYIQPNQPSEEYRNAVASYIRLLITKCFPCQVFTFGSVPLKTYLLDGDIDLTACSDNKNLKDTWVTAVRGVLENEEKNKNAEFQIKQVQYIHAEVKIVKCLVDDILVDISFNQVGGLCTLCFLEEVDDLISQNHLFKRSIMLIKAWCFYESHILGAHHGLISTYALEILVLYIFHLFNNSFAGPFEVLYRFLEFFSNFDWDNFCVSLWGPVPIRSLPDMIAEVPRKDNGKLFLSEGFLDGCNRRYSAIPREQESQTQPFVSKHFNVVDPLRINNNLGRSVSKSNFSRIRNAFSFGAKILAKLLDCPLDNIIVEVDQFFTNTWERQRSGYRPDVSSLNLRQVQLVSNVQIDELKNSKTTKDVRKKIENAPIDLSHEHVFFSVHDQDSKLQIQNVTKGNHHKNYGISNSSSSLVSSSKKYSNGQVNSRVPDKTEGNTTSNGVHIDTMQKMQKPINSLVEEGHNRFQFTRTRSTPELAQAAPGLSNGRNSSILENRKTEDPYLGMDFSSRNSNSTSAPMRQIPSNKSLEGVSDTNITSKGSNNLHHDFHFRIVGEEELTSASQALDMQQEEQDLINMMYSSNIHMFNGQVHLQTHVPSQFPLAFPSVPSQIGVSRRSWKEVYPTSLSLIGPSWESNMQFAPGPVSAPLSYHLHNATLRPSHNNVVEFVNEVSLAMEMNSEDSDQSICHGNDVVISQSFNSDDNRNQFLHLDSKPQKSNCGLNPIQTSQTAHSGALLQKNQFSREGRHSVLEDGADLFQNREGRGTEYSANYSGATIRSSQASDTSSSISISEEENLSDVKVPKLARDRSERKLVMPSSFGRSKGGSQLEVSSNLPDVDDTTLSWSPLSSEETGVTGSSSVSGNMSSQRYSLEPAELMGPDHFIPFSQILVDASMQSRGNNHNVLPVTCFPTGPPFPFVMVPVPVYGSVSASQFESLDEVDHGGTSSSSHNIDPAECSDSADIFLSLPPSMMSEPESSDEHKSDILNSDRNGHWQNLEYGRSCQNSASPGHWTFPLLISPIHLQGHIPCGHGRPISAANQNLAQLIGYGPHLVPMIPLHPRSGGASGGFQHYGEEEPRYRGGTGTYLPNPKVSTRQRQSNSRTSRWNNNNGRHDNGDREESWINSKPRSSGRGQQAQARNQSERLNSRHKKVAATENHIDGRWDSHGDGPSSSYHVQNNSSGPMNSSHDSGVAPLAFGPLGPVPLAKVHGAAAATNGVPATPIHKQRHVAHRRGSQRPSPSQPAPPPLKR